MRNIIPYLSLSLLSILLIGCKHTAGSSDDAADQLITPTHSWVIQSEPTNIGEMKINGNQAISYNYQQDNFIEVFSYPDFKLKYTYGTFGQGPGEWVSRMYGSSTKENEILVYDIMQSKLRVLSCNDSGISVTDSIQPLPTMDGLVMPYGKIAKIGNDLYLAKENNMDGGRLVAIDLAANKVFSEYKPELSIINSRVQGYPIDDFHFDNNEKRALLAFENIDYIVLLSLEDGKLSILKEIGTKSTIDMATKKPEDVFALQVAENKGNFYVLYSEGGERYGTKVRIFDDEGNEKGSVKLAYPTTLIAFDDNDALVALTEEEDHNIIYTYNLN